MPRLLSTTRNTRALLPDSLRFVRSDVPCAPTEGEIQWLLEHDLRTVIDLREENECRCRPCPLADHPAFHYLWMPVTGGGALPDTPDLVSASYIRMVDKQMGHILNTILTAGSNVLYFCSAGKDRTGVVSALLLRALGADRETILADYLASAECLEEFLRDYDARNPAVDPEIITPQRRYMEEFLDWLDS